MLKTMLFNGYKIVQAENYHVSIYEINTKHKVFHCQSDKELNEEGVIEMIYFYEMIKQLN